MNGPKSAAIQYVGFPRNHRIMGFAIIGFFRKELEISGAKKLKCALLFLSRRDKHPASCL